MGLGSRVFTAGLVIGAGALIVAGVVVAPKALRSARPTLRGVMKTTLRTYAKVRSAAAELAEDVEDLFAEVKAELADAKPKEAEPPGESAEAKSAVS